MRVFLLFFLAGCSAPPSISEELDRFDSSDPRVREEAHLRLLRSHPSILRSLQIARPDFDEEGRARLDEIIEALEWKKGLSVRYAREADLDHGISFEVVLKVDCLVVGSPRLEVSSVLDSRGQEIEFGPPPLSPSIGGSWGSYTIHRYPPHTIRLSRPDFFVIQGWVAVQIPEEWDWVRFRWPQDSEGVQVGDAWGAVEDRTSTGCSLRLSGGFRDRFSDVSACLDDSGLAWGRNLEGEIVTGACRVGGNSGGRYPNGSTYHVGSHLLLEFPRPVVEIWFRWLRTRTLRIPFELSAP